MNTIPPPDIMEQMARMAPKSEMHIVANSAHLTPLECPEEFAQIVQNDLGFAMNGSSFGEISNADRDFGTCHP